MNRSTAAAVMVGGVLGAASRWAVIEFAGSADRWPWPLLVVNLAGCAALGILVGRWAPRTDAWFVGATVGYCGSLTTFSGLAVDLATFLRDGEPSLFVSYLGASIIGGLVAFAAGQRIGAAR